MVALTIVDEVDEMLGDGPEIFEDLEDFVKIGKQPLTMMNHFTS